MRIVNLDRTFIIAFIMLILVGDRAVKADLYDVSADWSDTVNPNGVWSYWVNDTLASSYMRGGDPFYSPGQPIWALWNYTYFGWSKSNGTNYYQWDLQVGDVYGHTSSGGSVDPLEIRWTSPLAGSVDVSGGVWAIRDIGRSNYWQLTLNGSVLTDGYVYSGDAYDRSNPFPINLNFNVDVGDIVAFTTWKTSTSQYGDYIALDLSINVVPVPAAVLLGILGLSVAGWELRKFA